VRPAEKKVAIVTKWNGRKTCLGLFRKGTGQWTKGGEHRVEEPSGQEGTYLVEGELAATSGAQGYTNEKGNEGEPEKPPSHRLKV